MNNLEIYFGSLHISGPCVTNNTIITKESIGRGIYGEVDMVEFISKKNRKRVLVMKTCDLFNDENIIADTLICEIIFTYGGTRVIETLGVEIKEEKAILYMYKGINQFWIKTKQTNENIIKWTKEILLAVNQIHQRNIAHNDIKPDNMVMLNNRIVFIDFGLSSIFNNTQNSEVHTLSFRPPELFNEIIEPYNYEADIWAVGMSLLYMITNTHMFIEIPENPIIFFEDLVSHIKDIIQEKNLPLETCKTIELCLCIDPNKRKTSSDIYRLVFKKKIPQFISKTPSYPLEIQPILNKCPYPLNDKQKCIFVKLLGYYTSKNKIPPKKNIIDALTYIVIIISGDSTSIKNKNITTLNKNILKILSVCSGFKF